MFDIPLGMQRSWHLNNKNRDVESATFVPRLSLGCAASSTPSAENLHHSMTASPRTRRISRRPNGRRSQKSSRLRLGKTADVASLIEQPIDLRYRAGVNTRLTVLDAKPTRDTGAVNVSTDHPRRTSDLHSALQSSKRSAPVRVDRLPKVRQLPGNQQPGTPVP